MEVLHPPSVSRTQLLTEAEDMPEALLNTAHESGTNRGRSAEKE